MSNYRSLSLLNNKQTKALVIPIVAFLVFLAVWHISAASIITSLGQVPGPSQVWSQTIVLVDEHIQEREKAEKFYQRQIDRNVKKLEKNPHAIVKIRNYTGNPTFIDQVGTSLITVLTGFFIASVIAIPIGVFSGLSSTVHKAINPLIQIFKPVSPLAWLPIVTIIVSAVYTSENPMFAKSFVTSAITVTLCCIWPTIINTTLGVSSIDQDLKNVSRVLRLSWMTNITKIVIPSSVPMIFAGLRLSLGIGWMVLIAAEMLAQNPGLGKFVWDEFQNGSSNSLARIMVAVFVIGFIGFMLDQIMLLLQRKVSWDKTAEVR
ncbi:MAG: nitrate ABC transporter permease [endosymbiont of Galathealinum brachiosum]|uniref:Nitrate ABC transporter permease n=1 Tax=endosymbiont of Galathealinum brachiosum TaxID=2200906 RepID=A0A370DKR6_9GAMM|nr:MAG: nitrate ABC transporter permease [endosymbiont of Galathealinum brachiosum]